MKLTRPYTDFRPYLKDRKLTLRSVALRVGVEEAHFHRVISGLARMSVEMAKKIDAATEGYLPAGFLLGLEPFAKPTHQDNPPEAA